MPRLSILLTCVSNLGHSELPLIVVPGYILSYFISQFYNTTMDQLLNHSQRLKCLVKTNKGRGREVPASSVIGRSSFHCRSNEPGRVSPFQHNFSSNLMGGSRLVAMHNLKIDQLEKKRGLLPCRTFNQGNVWVYPNE